MHTRLDKTIGACAAGGILASKRRALGKWTDDELQAGRAAQQAAYAAHITEAAACRTFSRRLDAEMARRAAKEAADAP